VSLVSSEVMESSRMTEIKGSAEKRSEFERGEGERSVTYLRIFFSLFYGLCNFDQLLFRKYSLIKRRVEDGRSIESQLSLEGREQVGFNNYFGTGFEEHCP
jgi:hypothetical protein